MVSETEADDCEEGLKEFASFPYLIVNPNTGRVLDLLWYCLRGDAGRGVKFLEWSEDLLGQVTDLATLHKLVIVGSVILRKIVLRLRKPLEWTGVLVESTLNGGFLGLIRNLVRGKVEAVPSRCSGAFMSTIGHLDRRIDLYRDYESGHSAEEERTLKAEVGNRALMDLCIMASKLAYENEEFVRKVVLQHWKMHLVDFLPCWNYFQQKCSTHVLILCDKPVDPSLILISFRGTEPFDAYDWCTDLDISWYEIPNLGKVHMGFLQALGLRNNRSIPQHKLQVKEAEFTRASGASNREAWPKKSAYYKVSSKLWSLLEEHKNAKFVVTGHSLGGALAILFPTLLVMHEKMEMMERLLGVYTFGQPRVGDEQLQRSMEKYLDHPHPKYFRVVYCNDPVPRVPCDNRLLLYKHFGVCLYYDRHYSEKEMKDEPNRNYFNPRYLIPMCMNAVWELIRGVTMGCTHGAEYKEGWFSILFRIAGVVFPGVSAHSPTDYVNSMRLGKKLQVN